MSIRLRIAVLSALVTGLVLTVAGVVLVGFVERQARSELDARLEEDFEDARTRGTVRILLQTLRDPSIDPNNSTLAFFFTGRVFVQGELLGESENVPELTVDPDRAGFTTIDDEDGITWRVLTSPADIFVDNIADQGPLAVQVMLPTQDTEETIADVRTTAQRLGVGGIVVVAVAAWVLSWAALRPLRRLADEAARVSTTIDLERRVPDSGPPETRTFARSLNAMLGRLGRSAHEREAALETARGFAADVGHEVRAPLTSMATDLDVLDRNPGLDPDERRAIVGDLLGQHARVVRLLDELGSLARGDLGEQAGRDMVDVAGVVETSIDAVRHHHPEVEWAVDIDEAAMELEGSSEGLRILMTNLLDNATTHGRAPGSAHAAVGVRVRRDGDYVVIDISDDGPGVQGRADELFERFRRGAGADGDGSGLGLAIVRQQAERHGGEVILRQAGPDGGTRATVRLPLPPIAS